MHPLEEINFNQANFAAVIEASAGSGKTWTLERLFIKALLQGQRDNSSAISLEDILVVTFTKDATRELRTRMQKQIQVTISKLLLINNGAYNVQNNNDYFDEFLYSRREYFRRDLTILSRSDQNFDAASIYTIHGFCERVLQNFNLSFKYDSDLEITDSYKPIYKMIVRDFMRTQIINKYQDQNLVGQIYRNLGLIFSDYDDLVDAIVDELPNNLTIFDNFSFNSQYTLSSFDNLDFLLEEIKDANIVCDYFISYVINYIVKNFHLYKHKYINYDELIQRVTSGITNSTTIADSLYTKYPIVFIDEFQDTDDNQWHIFSTIYNLNNVVRGCVIVVGDPKQAIYKFRGADVNTYLSARRQINSTLNLEYNFRSNVNILNFINQIFLLKNQGRDINNSIFGANIDYYPIKTGVKNPSLALPSVNQIENQFRALEINQRAYSEDVQIVVITGEGAKEKENNLLKNLTFEILSLLKSDPSLIGKIAILVAKNSEGKKIINYLRKFNIKAADLKLTSIYATTTANDLLIFLNSLNNLTNRNLFMQAITTKLFNIPLADIINNNEVNPTVERLQEDFFNYNEIWQKSGIVSLIYAVIKNLQQGNIQESKYQFNNRELANLIQLSELLSQNNASNIADFLLWFKQKIDSALDKLSIDETLDSEMVLRLDNDDEQITVTTQHKAKGLEYEILFCPYFKSMAKKRTTAKVEFGSYIVENGRISTIINEDNREIYFAEEDFETNRLNYVALTRAKSRLYIYLKQPKYSPKGLKYSQNSKTDKIVELFGYNKEDTSFTSHPLFNYHDFFTQEPMSAIKQQSLMPSLIAYQRQQLKLKDLNCLKFINSKKENKQNKLLCVKPSFNYYPAFMRQSYSSLTYKPYSFADHFTDNEDAIITTPIKYKYSILSDSNIYGAQFGVLFHELCECYPITNDKLDTILDKSNIISLTQKHKTELIEMIEQSFSYPIIDNIGLKDLSQYIHELEFNLTIQNETNFKQQFYAIIKNYFGEQHKFTQAVLTLDKIAPGFLVGFIDLMFEYKGKYWVLDYKTNKLNDYTAPIDVNDTNNSILNSMAEHHYYIQYIIYLVALKRYLEFRLGVKDATNLIGGAIYYYVRAVFTDNVSPGDGIFIDNNCSELISQIDQILK